MNTLQQQFYDYIADEFHRIEVLKSVTLERGEIITNITNLHLQGKITKAEADGLIEQVCDGEVGTWD